MQDEPPPEAEQQPAPVRAIVAQINADRSSAVVSVRAGPAAGEEELRRALEEAGVLAGKDEAACARLALRLKDPAFAIERTLIARACPAQPGEAGRFESVYLLGLQPGHVREDGTLDFHDRELLKPVQTGDVIGRVWPARAGVAGQLVDGAALLPPPVREVALVLGAGAQRDAGGVLRAARAGVVVCPTPQAIDVVDHYTHEGPVDLHSGHLHMLGSLLVKGDVQNAFGVSATGDVEIRGSVDNGDVYAGGNVRIQRGVRGGGASVCAEGNLTLHHVESASLFAGGVLSVHDAVHAQLAAPRVEVSGRLRGGRAAAELVVLVQEAGSPQAIPTEVAVAEPLELPVAAARRALEHAKAVRGTRRGDLRGGPAERAKGGKTGRVKAALQDAETRRLAQRAHRRQELAQAAFIEIHVAHPGVTLRVGEQLLLIEQETRGSRFSLDGQTRQLRADRISP